MHVAVGPPKALLPRDLTVKHVINAQSRAAGRAHPDANRLLRSRVRGERTGGAPAQSLALLFYLSGEPVSNARLATSASISIVAKVE